MSKILPDNCFQMIGKYFVSSDIGLDGSVTYNRLKMIPTEKSRFPIPSEDLSEERRQTLIEKIYAKLSESYREKVKKKGNDVVEVKIPILKNVEVNIWNHCVKVYTGLKGNRIMGKESTPQFKDVLRNVESVLETFDEPVK